ncbi:MAG: InlB B-repeat-containing protein, partial [Candidatus Natronoplasma sp.]
MKWKKYLTFGIIIFLTVGSAGTTLGMTETVKRENIESSHSDEDNSLQSNWEAGEKRSYDTGATDTLTEGRYFIQINGGSGQDADTSHEDSVGGDGGDGGYVEGYIMADEDDEISVTCYEGGSGGSAGDGGDAVTVNIDDTRIATAHGGGGGGLYIDHPDSHEFEDSSAGGGGGAIDGDGGEADEADLNYDGEDGEDGPGIQGGGDGGRSYGLDVADGIPGKGEINSDQFYDEYIKKGGSEASSVEGKVYLKYVPTELKTDIKGEGEVEVEGEGPYFDYGTEVTITAIPNEHWYFDEWTGDASGSEEQITITMDEDKSVTAKFE